LVPTAKACRATRNGDLVVVLIPLDTPAAASVFQQKLRFSTEQVWSLFRSKNSEKTPDPFFSLTPFFL
jgi:hypothetical protein